MPLKHACVALALLHGVLASSGRAQPAAAQQKAETPPAPPHAAATVLIVPVPVPAKRPAARTALPPPPPPPPPPADPIEVLAGRWSGEGTMVPLRGRNEPFRCIITYAVEDDASRVRQHLRCQGDSTRFDAVTRFIIDDDNRVTGVWADNIYSIGGTLAGKVTDKGFDIRLYSTFFQAKMTVASTACEQSVKVVPETRVSMKELTAALKKC